MVLYHLRKTFAAGFRPFFLGAAWLAVIWMLLWLWWLYSGIGDRESIPLIQWHTHEMLFGYVMAVLAGFLLTAMQNWTGRHDVTMRQLGLLFGVWLLARLCMLMPDRLPLLLITIIDLAFLPLLGIVVGRTLVAAGNRRNYVFPFLLLAFWLLNGTMHLQWHGIISGVITPAQDLTVLLIVVLLVFMGGRVIPFFTDRRLPEVRPRQWPWLNWVASLSCLCLLPAYVLLGRDGLALPAALAATLVLVRWLAWRPWRVCSEPMLWILHAGYGWIPPGLMLLALADNWSAGLHGLMVGAMGSLTLGMMARVALGHSGRVIQAGPWLIVAFIAISLAAVARVLAALMAGGGLLELAGLLWSLAMLIYALVYTPILTDMERKT